jgi:hypothetical protein
MKKLGIGVLIAGAIMASTPACASTLVYANSSTPTFLGTFGPGTYNITGSGLVDLVGEVDSGFTVKPDGTPNTSVTYPGYSYFNPSGSTSADGNYGPGGSGIKIGALMGSFGSSPSSYFLIGFSKTISLTSTESLYGLVNDTYYSNNGGAFSVAVSSVPEPATWALMILGFGMIGFALRTRAKVRTTVSYT